MKKEFKLSWIEDLSSKQLDGHLFAADAARLERHEGSIRDLALFGLLTQPELERIQKRLDAQIRAAVARHDYQGLRPSASRKGARK